MLTQLGIPITFDGPCHLDCYGHPYVDESGAQQSDFHIVDLPHGDPAERPAIAARPEGLSTDFTDVEPVKVPSRAE